eukprot:273305-Hanusia_phi.AAC.2
MVIVMVMVNGGDGGGGGGDDDDDDEEEEEEEEKEEAEDDLWIAQFNSRARAGTLCRHLGRTGAYERDEEQQQFESLHACLFHLCANKLSQDPEEIVKRFAGLPPPHSP